jgi:hypothetical protein
MIYTGPAYREFGSNGEMVSFSWRLKWILCVVRRTMEVHLEVAPTRLSLYKTSSHRKLKIIRHHLSRSPPTIPLDVARDVA